MMLALTDAAVDVISELTEQPDLPPSVGLRISSDPAQPGGSGLAAALTVGPGPDDEVVDVREGRLYLEREAADHLSDKVLDAERDGSGEIVFHVRHRDGK